MRGNRKNKLNNHSITLRCCKGTGHVAKAQAIFANKREDDKLIFEPFLLMFIIKCCMKYFPKPSIKILNRMLFFEGRIRCSMFKLKLRHLRHIVYMLFT